MHQLVGAVIPLASTDPSDSISVSMNRSPVPLMIRHIKLSSTHNHFTTTVLNRTSRVCIKKTINKMHYTTSYLVKLLYKSGTSCVRCMFVYVLQQCKQAIVSPATIMLSVCRPCVPTLSTFIHTVQLSHPEINP